MAKKKAAGGFNMAAEIRKLLAENEALSAKEVYAELKKRFPKQKINEASCGVAYSLARKQLGLAPARRAAKTREPGGKEPLSAAKTVDLAALRAAARYVAEVGDADKAIEAILQVRDLCAGASPQVWVK